ncbi:hypothetical protein BHE74_00022390 [Ensete ventricosum]|nr:hypothetical protein BHE74_00022390 [Ensete ventricosum]
MAVGAATVVDVGQGRKKEAGQRQWQGERQQQQQQRGLRQGRWGRAAWQRRHDWERRTMRRWQRLVVAAGEEEGRNRGGRRQSLEHDDVKMVRLQQGGSTEIKRGGEDYDDDDER